MSSIKATRRRSPESKEGFRQTIIETAKHILASEGYESVSIRNITARVGVTPMAFYRYFAGKQQVVRCIWEDTFSELERSLLLASPGQHEPLQRLRVLIEAYIDFWLSRPESFAAIFIKESGGPRGAACEANFLRNPSAKAILDAWDNAIRECFGNTTDAIRAARITRDVMLAQALGVIHVLSAVSPDCVVDRDAVRRASVNVLLSAVPGATPSAAMAS